MEQIEVLEATVESNNSHLIVEVFPFFQEVNLFQTLHWAFTNSLFKFEVEGWRKVDVLGSK